MSPNPDPDMAEPEAELELEPDDVDEAADTRSAGERIRELVEAEAEAAELEPEEPDAITAALAEAVAEHQRRVTELVGEGIPFRPCPLCVGMGLVTLELEHDPTTQRCDRCNGRGRVLTWSLVDSRETRSCGKCNGEGFLELAAEPGAEAVHPPAVTAPVILPPSMLPTPDAAPAPALTG